MAAAYGELWLPKPNFVTMACLMALATPDCLVLEACNAGEYGGCCHIRDTYLPPLYGVDPAILFYFYTTIVYGWVFVFCSLISLQLIYL